MIDWFSVALAAFSGGVAGAIVTLFMPNRSEQKGTYIVACLVVFFLLNSLTKHYILIPHQIDQAKRSFTETPIIQTLRKYDPSTFNNVMRTLDESLKNEGNVQSTILKIRSEVDLMLQKRLPIASDDAVLAYVSVMIQEMRVLNTDPENCRKALNPRQYGSINIKDFLPKELANADLASLADVIKTSAEQPQPIPRQYEISSDMETVIREMKIKHPDSSFTLASASPTEAQDACNATADLFETINTTLPSERSSKVIRFILSQK